jgi:hypothetical protein
MAVVKSQGISKLFKSLQVERKRLSIDFKTLDF